VLGEDHRGEEGGRRRRGGTYVAGMTDAMPILEHRRLFEPGERSRGGCGPVFSYLTGKDELVSPRQVFVAPTPYLFFQGDSVLPHGPCHETLVNPVRP